MEAALPRLRVNSARCSALPAIGVVLARGYRITETLQDYDLSGRIWRHRHVERAIGVVEQDPADALVVLSAASSSTPRQSEGTLTPAPPGRYQTTRSSLL